MPEVVESLGIGHGVGIEFAAFDFIGEMPLADDPGGVSGRLQDLGHRDLFGMRDGVELFDVSWFGDADRVGTRHQGGA